MRKRRFYAVFGMCAASVLAFAGPVDALTAADVVGKSAFGARIHGGDEIILQGFHWNSTRTSPQGWYGLVEANADQIRDLGITSVWMPPPWRDNSRWGDESGNGTNGGGGEGYFWFDFSKDSKYGSDAQLKAAATALKRNSVKVLYDIVANHRSAQDNSVTPPAYPKGTSSNFWRQDCSACDDGDPFMSGDADLNVNNPIINNDFAAELENLVTSYAAEGFRFDYVRGFAAKHVDGWMTAKLDNGLCIGEYWKDPIAQDSLNTWSRDASCSVFDFALKKELNSGDITRWKFGMNSNPVADWRERAVTFIDNHDTGWSPGSGGQHHWPFPDGQWGGATFREAAYAFILTTPGTPTVYWPDAFDWGRFGLIHTLIKARKAADVRAWSSVTYHDDFPGIVATVQGAAKKLVLSIGSPLDNPNLVTDGTFDLAASGGWGKVWKQR